MCHQTLHLCHSDGLFWHRVSQIATSGVHVLSCSLQFVNGVALFSDPNAITPLHASSKQLAEVEAAATKLQSAWSRSRALSFLELHAS